MTAWAWFIFAGIFLVAGILAIVYRTAAIFGGPGRGVWGIVAGVIALACSVVAIILGAVMAAG